MSDLLAEVDEIMRQERIMKLWKDHGHTFISIIAAVIIGTGAASAYKAWDANQRIESTNTFLDVVRASEFPKNIEETQLDIRPGLKGIVLITAASEFMVDGENEKALELYTQAVSDESIPSDLKHLAQLNIAKLSSGAADDKIAQLQAIIDDENSPWRFHAILQHAVIIANERGNYQDALTTLDTILKTPNLPNTLYIKAQSLSEVYTLKMKEQPKS